MIELETRKRSKKRSPICRRERVSRNAHVHELAVLAAVDCARSSELRLLRDTLGLTGTKFGCGIGACGACTVHIDGAARRSCQVPTSSLALSRVTTIEGLTSLLGRRLQEAWLIEDVAQCGYCQTGQLMSAAALLAAKPTPSDAEIDAALAGVEPPTLRERPLLGADLDRCIA